MKVLHYSLGFPPFRSGGLTKYCTDLMLSQKERGHEVALLWPGEINRIKAFSIKRRRDVLGLKSFEVINPLPVPYDEGVKAVQPYIAKRDPDVYLHFLELYEPDVLHVHTIMGAAEGLFETAHDLGVRMVFTTHDYFPVCPRVSLYRNGSRCIEEKSCLDCPQCNAEGLGHRQIALLQSPAYRIFKDHAAMRTLRSRHRLGVAERQFDDSPESMPQSSVEDYRILRQRNIRILSRFDVIHANSSIAAAIYRHYLPQSKIEVVPVTHRDMHKVNPSTGRDMSGCWQIGYLGPASDAKGYYLLLESLRSLWEKGVKFELSVYGAFKHTEPFLKVHPRYGYAEIDSVFERMDVLVVPSVWPETFGFTVMEALCHGVPVVVSENVGAKDILDDGFGAIFPPRPADCEAAIASCLDKDALESMRGSIAERFTPPDISEPESKLYAKEVS